MRMRKTQVYLRENELRELHRIRKETGRSLAELIREAIQRVWLKPASRGPVGLWSGQVKRTDVDHDSIYDKP